MSASTFSNIYLIGLPGSGKSTLGKQVSRELGIKFYDLDQYIEDRAGKDINRIFLEDGEEGFRLIERDCLHQLSLETWQKVVATGGGTPCFHGNIDHMNTHGISVFLDVPVEVIAERLQEQGTNERPLLKNKSPQELLGQLQDHFIQRKSYYLKALIHLEGPAISPDQILDELNSL